MDHEYLDSFDKFLNLIYTNYKNAPHFSEVFTLVESVVGSDSRSVAVRNANSIWAVFEYLDIKKNFTFSSSLSIDDEFRGAQRVIRVCELKSATTYVNPIGGRSLYEAQGFSEAGVSLEFIKPRLLTYKQENAPFVPSLSMLDVLMWNSKSRIRDYLQAYSIV
jgi:hypothetical protein